MSDFTAIALVVVAFVLAGVALAALGWVLAAARRNARLLTVPAHDAPPVLRPRCPRPVPSVPASADPAVPSHHPTRR